MPIRRLLAAAGLCFLLAGPCLAQPSPDDLLAAFHQRGRQLLQVYQPALFRNPDVKIRGYDTIAYVALQGCGPSKMSDDMVDILRPDLIAKSADKAAYAFVLPPFTRYFLEYGRCLSRAQVSRAGELLAQPQLLFSHGTLNHAIMSASSYYLLAEYMPSEAWISRSGQHYTSAEIMARYRALLLGRLQKFLTDGSNEQLSPTYALANLFPVLNLVDFAQDSEVRAKAEQVAVAQIALMRTDSLDGALMPPLTRENAPVQITSNPATNARDVLWLYYGGFGPIDGRRYEPPYVAMLASSTWRPPALLLELKSQSDLPYDLEVNTPTFGIWDAKVQPELLGGAWIDKDFAIGAGNDFADPGGHNEHNVTFRILIRGLQPVGIIDCYQPYWLADEGEDVWDLDRSSPFQRNWRSNNRGVLLYDIPSSDPYRYPMSNPVFAARVRTAEHLHQVAECRLPSRATELNITSHGVFARYGTVFIALRSLGSASLEINRNPQGPNLKGFVTVKVRAPRSAIFYEAKPAGQNEGLATFERETMNNGFGYDEGLDAATVIDNRGRSISVGFVAGSIYAANQQDTQTGTFITNPLLPVNQGVVLRSSIFSLQAGEITMHTKR